MFALFRLCSRAPISLMRCPHAAPPRRGHGDGQLAAPVLRGQRALLLRQAFDRAGIHHAAAVFARAEAHVDQVVGHRNHVGIVLHDEDGVALVAQHPQDGNQLLVVARVQADRGLVEHVERPHQRGAKRRRQVDALRLAAGQRGRQTVQRQVVQADIPQEAEAPPDLVQHLVNDRHVLLGQAQGVEEALGFAHGLRRHPVDRQVAHAHVARFAAQPRAAAVRARLVAAIAAEEHADVDLVLLLLQPLEEAADAVVVVVIALDDEAALGFRQIGPRRVQPDVVRLGDALQRGQVRAIVRLGPRLDRALVDRLGLIGHHQVQVQLDDVAEAVAGRAGAERVVEREEAGLRVLVGDVAGPALEALGELVPHRRAAVRGQLDGPRRAAAFLIRGLDGVGGARAHLAFDAQPVHHHADRRPALQHIGRQIVERDRLTVHQQAAEALATQLLDDRQRRGGCAGLGAGRHFLVPRLRRIVHGRGAHVHEREVVANQQAGAFGELAQAVGDDLGGFADHFLAAVAADGLAHAREQQAHVVVDLGDRGDRRARITDRVLLADGDGRADAVDAVHVGLLHPLQELAGVGGERLHVAALPFRVDGVEGQRRLARSAHAGDDDELADGQREADVLQVVRTRAAHDDGRAVEGGGRHDFRVCGYVRARRERPKHSMIRRRREAFKEAAEMPRNWAGNRRIPRAWTAPPRGHPGTRRQAHPL